MTDRTDADKLALLREKQDILYLQLEEQQYEIDDLKQGRDGLLEQVEKAIAALMAAL